MAIPTTIAVVFDFDDTLVPDSTTLLLEKYGINPTIFWKKELGALLQSAPRTAK
jgi:hypothetical protein